MSTWTRLSLSATALKMTALSFAMLVLHYSLLKVTLLMVTAPSLTVARFYIATSTSLSVAPVCTPARPATGSVAISSSVVWSSSGTSRFQTPAVCWP